MNNLISTLMITHFQDILSAYKRANIPLGHFIDGGAGFGSTTEECLEFLGSENKVFSFEPFPGNAQFFDKYSNDERVTFIPKALSNSNSVCDFIVGNVVQDKTDWGDKGLVGYSSTGKLATTHSGEQNIIRVECVRCDDELFNVGQIGFIKLDLQGGEVPALKGMQNIMNSCSFMWIELLHSNLDLYRFLQNQDFLIFDTEYLFLGEPSADAADWFHITETGGKLSTGATYWKGLKKRPWYCFEEEFRAVRERFGMIQTDLFCVNKNNIDQFLIAAQYLAVSNR